MCIRDSATGGAIRARPVVPIMVSSLVVVFTCIEMLVLPFVAQHFLSSEPLVAGAWMGLAVKSDGGAIASGAITESLILAKMAGQGNNWEPGWIVMVTTTVKIFIDVFIGVWALVLAYVWTAKFDKTRGERTMTWGDVMDRFPRFVLGYIATFLILLLMCLSSPELHKLGKSLSGTINGSVSYTHLDVYKRQVALRKNEPVAVLMAVRQGRVVLAAGRNRIFLRVVRKGAAASVSACLCARRSFV